MILHISVIFFNRKLVSNQELEKKFVIVSVNLETSFDAFYDATAGRNEL